MGNTSVVVTGAASGIGAAIAAELHRSHHVVAVDLRRSNHPQTAAYTWVTGDVADPHTHEEAADRAADAGVLTGWVNNAGVVESAPLHAIADEVIDATLKTNLGGAIRGTRAAIRAFLEHGTRGAIVNISSIHARGAFPGTPAYDSSKGGIEALTRYTAAEYGHLGIRSNAVAPGAIRTEMLARAIAEAEDPEGEERGFSALHPLNRLGEPAEVARAVRFLLSEDASFVSGATLAVDGGAAARVFGYAPHPDVPANFSEPFATRSS